MSKVIYKNLTKEEIIDSLVNKDIECITENPMSIENGLLGGLKGYNNMSDENIIELYQEYCEEDGG
jgi:hypothetical protein